MVNASLANKAFIDFRNIDAKTREDCGENEAVLMRASV